MMSKQQRGQTKPAAKSGADKESLLSLTRLSELSKILKTNRQVNSILSQINGEISIRLTAGGQVVSSVKKRDSNDHLCEVDDLRRLGTFSQFINSERKSDVSNQTLEPILLRFYINKGAGINPVPLTSGRLIIAKETYQKMSNIMDNLERISERRRIADQEETCNYLTRVCWKSLNVLRTYFVAIYNGDVVRDAVHDALKTNLIPVWLYSKLSGGKIYATEDLDVRRFLFPVDGSKSIACTLPELLNQAFLEENRFILTGSRLLLYLIEEQFMLRYFGNEYNAGDFETRFMSQIKDQRLNLGPIYGGKFLIEGKLKGKFSTFKLVTGDTPAAAMARLNNACVRTMAYEGAVVNPGTELHHVLFPGADFSVTRPDRTFFHIMAERATCDNVLGNYVNLVGDDIRGVVLKQIVSELRLAIGSQAFIGIRDRLVPNVAAAGIDPLPNGVPHFPAGAVDDAFKNENTLFMKPVELTGIDLAGLQIFSTAVMKDVRPTKKKGTLIKVSPITKLAIEVLDILDETNSKGHKKPIADWVQTFRPDLQPAAAQFAIAQLDVREEFQSGTESEESSV